MDIGASVRCGAGGGTGARQLAKVVARPCAAVALFAALAFTQVHSQPLSCAPAHPGASAVTATGGVLGALLSAVGAGSATSSAGSVGSTGVVGGVASDGARSALACVPGEPASIAQLASPAIAGNPVDLLTGAKLDRVLDYRVSSVSAIGPDAAEFVFTRLYASGSAGSAALGPGWRLGLQVRLHAARIGARVVPELVQGDGRRIRFATESRPVDAGARFTSDFAGDGVLEQPERPASAQEHWVWRWPNGRALSFDVEGRLRRIVSQGGPVLTLGYDRSDRLVEVASSAAQRLRLHYRASGAARLAAVSDSGGVRVRYDYDGRDRLVTAAYADGAMVRYRYTDASEARLSAVTLPDGATSEYRYSDDGRVVYSRAPGDGESGALHFVHGQPDAATRAFTVRVSQGGVERAAYRFEPVGARGVVRMTSSQGIGCEACPATGWRYVYDRGGELNTLERAKFRARVARDPRGDPVALALLDGSGRRVTVPRANGAGVEGLTLSDGTRVARWRDDHGRTVAIAGPASGRNERSWGANERLVAERYADGGQSRFDYDAFGRVVLHVQREATKEETSTSVAWTGDEVAAVEHPEQVERYERDKNGRVVARHLRLRLESGETAPFALDYRYDEAGRLVAWSLPAGGWIHAVRDGHAQVVALEWQPAAAETASAWRTPLVSALERDATGLRRAVLGNRVVVDFRRGTEGALQRIHEHTAARIGSRTSPDTVRIDHAFQFDRARRLLEWKRGTEARRHVFDERGQLVQAVHESAAGRRLWRYAYDANGNRTLAVQDGAATERDRRAELDAAGRVARDGTREYRWNASGNLTAVIESGRVIARYRYNHRRERVAKRVALAAGDHVTHYLYDPQRRLLAELDAGGEVQRQYVYLADRPIAVLDRVATRAGANGAFVVRYLHLNHLGAPEAASDERAHVIWRADYAPFGRRLPMRDARSGFDLALRLPGQYEDGETGLHYNDHRYYDPDTGRYLSPDPLGLAAGSNVYAYAGNNPLTNVDPSGLALFAFDGTNNSDAPPRRDDWSNVYKLARSYADGRVWYMAGVGQADAASGIAPGRSDAITAASARSRVDFLLGELGTAAAASARSGAWLDVDVIGFSRGAAMARDFSNRVADRIRGGEYAALGACVRLRFLGLWDTVAQFGPDGIANAAWKLAVPAEVGHAAHAVALNEHRTLFPLESIVGSPLAGVRIERGFIGAHSDVGGSYVEGDLSDVSLIWMHEQSRLAGLRMFALTSEYARVTAPLLHDSTLGRSSDREVFYRNDFGWVAANPLQRVARIDGMQWRETAPFILRYATPQPDVYGEPTLAGLVDIVNYSNWLDANYAIRVPGTQ